MGIFDSVGKWLGDRLGLNAPKVTQPTLDANKQATNDELQKYVMNMVKGYQNYSPYGRSDQGAPQFFGMHKFYNPQATDPATLNALQQRVQPVGGAGSSAMDAYTQSGQMLRSGGYDPTLKALAYEQTTRGIDDQRDKDLNAMAEMFGGRGVLRSSAAVGKANDIRSAASDRKANALGNIVLSDLTTARQAQDRDISQAQTLDQKNYQAMMDMLGFAQRQSGGSPFNAQSELDYQNSLAKRQAWDDRWNTIISTAGKFF